MKEKIINVSFDACGGEVDVESLSYKPNEKLGNLPRPIRKGYTFDGWYTEKEGGEKLTSSDTASFEGDTVLFAHWIATQKKKKRSLYRTQKRAIVVLASVVLLLAIALPVVKYFVGRNAFYDIDPDKTKYYVQKKDGEYGLYDKNGVILKKTEDGFYSTKHGTLVKVDAEDGETQIVGVVGDIDPSSSEKLDYNTVRYLMFPTVFQSDYDYLEITNEHGTLKFVLDENDVFWIEGAKAHTYLDDAYYILCARISTAFGYTLAKEKLKAPKMLEDGSGVDYAEYGLIPETREDEDGNKYDYTPAKYTLKTKEGAIYTVTVGDAIVSDGGYYAKCEGNDAVYILGTELEIASYPIESFLSPIIMFPTTTANYYDVEDFLIAEFDYTKFNETQNKDDIKAEPKVCFSYIPMEQRENSLYSSDAYKILSSNLNMYRANSDTIMMNVLNNLRKAQMLGCVKYGLDKMTDEELDEYGLLYPKYSISFTQNNISYNVTDKSKYYTKDNHFYISEITENGTYYVCSERWNMIVEVEGDTFEFLNYTPIKWIDLSFFSHYLAHMEKLQIITPTLDKTFTFNNSESDQSEGPNANNIKVFLDGAQFLDLDNFTELYKTLLFSDIEGDIAENDERLFANGDPYDPSKLRLQIKYTAKDLNGTLEERTICFYELKNADGIGGGIELITINGQGGFYVKSERVAKIASDLAKLLNGEKIDSGAKY